MLAVIFNVLWLEDETSLFAGRVGSDEQIFAVARVLGNGCQLKQAKLAGQTKEL